MDTIRKRRIVLIDDSLANLVALEQHLESLEFEIDKFTSPLEALSAMLSETPHCVLVDVHLPDMDGLEFCRTVKRDPQLRHIPIVLVTGKVFSDNEATKAVQIGAFDYLTKPFNIVMLKSKIGLLTEFSWQRENKKLMEKIIKDKLELVHRDLLNSKETKRLADTLKDIQQELEELL